MGVAITTACKLGYYKKLVMTMINNFGNGSCVYVCHFSSQLPFVIQNSANLISANELCPTCGTQKFLNFLTSFWSFLDDVLDVDTCTHQQIPQVDGSYLDFKKALYIHKTLTYAVLSSVITSRQIHLLCFLVLPARPNPNKATVILSWVPVGFINFKN